MSIIAIIPARGGSKRIPHKNIKRFAGKPIIAYSIEAAREFNLFDRIIVSTDCEEVSEVAKYYGAEVPFKRPAELSDDFTETAPVLIHALSWLNQHNSPCKYFCCIYATAPLMQLEYIKEGFKLLIEKNATTVFSVTSFRFNISRALKINQNGYVKMMWSEYENYRSNDLPPTYHDAGQFYWGNTAKFLKEKKLFSSKSIPVILPRYLVQDIDTLEDWKTAEKMYYALKIND
jgi:pseudaminic acid cytidylyltransferase